MSWHRSESSDFITSWEHHDQIDDSCKRLSSVSCFPVTEGGHQYCAVYAGQVRKAPPDIRTYEEGSEALLLNVADAVGQKK